jgi:hypothetical protein
MLQVTPALLGSFPTPALKWTVPVTCISDDGGEMSTESGVGMTLAVTGADLVLSVTDVAVTSSCSVSEAKVPEGAV